jgi:hypothetical protein
LLHIMAKRVGKYLNQYIHQIAKVSYSGFFI